MKFFKNFINGLFNNAREEVNTPKTTWHKIPTIYFEATPEAREVIDNWLEANEMPANTFGKVLHEIGILSTDIHPDGLFGSTTISFEKEIVPINNSMRSDDFVGCLKFSTNGGLIPSDNKNSELLNYLLEEKDKIKYVGEKHYSIHYYIYLYKNGIKVVTKFFIRRDFGKYNGRKDYFYNLFNEYIVFIDTNNEVKITEISDTYDIVREKYENYTRTRTTDEISIDFNLLYYGRRDNIRIEMPRTINFDMFAEDKLIEDTLVSHRVSHNVLSVFRTIMPLVSAYLPTFKIFVKRADESKEALYYEKNNDCTKIAIATSRYGYPSEASIKYTCTIRNEIIDANSMKRVIEATNGYATISLTVVGYDIKEITNETKLITHLFSYFMTRDECKYTFDALWNDIVNDSFQDPPSNFTLVKLSQLDGEKTILEKEWHNYTYKDQQTQKKTGHLTRTRKLPKDTNPNKK